MFDVARNDTKNIKKSKLKNEGCFVTDCVLEIFPDRSS